MLSTSTHDTKRGEDLRMRLATLAEIPEQWSAQVLAWRKILHRESRALNDPGLEYFYYQTLLGSFPVDDFDRGEYRQRLEGALIKAAREARQRTSWSRPHEIYEDRLKALIGASLESTTFMDAFLPFQQALYVVANVLLLALAIGIATRSVAGHWLARAGMGAFGKILPWASPLTQRSRPAGRLALGALWGFVPCSLVYGVLPLALFAGGPWQGALVMLAFGLGTLPHLVGFGWVLQKARRLLRGHAARHIAAAVISGFALFGIYRALYLPHTLAQGPFCLPL